jgi:hypothetical protein
VRLKLELNEDTTVRLVERAAAERRLTTQQGEVLLRQALGLSFPQPYQGGQGSEVGSVPNLNDKSGVLG